ncbi:ankyrin-2-like isoform X2 [Cotesia glomerata]|uniref:ankyrin-2-like isoform X2 n=1 Tax=Cotesia glomerata TaxID=32391 RepID=UPI001D032D00|nr:ankyrin-2-like isoform X2 [Cotesia glomerata]
MVTDNTNQTDDTTAFLRAARSGNLEKVIEYLDLNLDINTSNSNGLNALHLASKDGHVEIVTELLKRGAKVDSATKKGNTALHIASLAGQVEVVNILLQYGAAVNTQSQNGFTPLYMAAQENHDQVVKLLLTNGANQSLATEDGFTPLAVAMQQGHDKVVSVLLENDSKGKVRLPALHIAAKKDDCKAADLLLQNDHKPDVTSKSGFTPLHIAAHYGNEEIGRLLIKRGADVNYLAKHNISPLHVAAKWGKNNMVKLLLENSAMIEAKTRDGLTPLHCAARSGHEEVVSTLLEHSAPISARTKNGLAPLHMASQGDHVDAARVLLYHRAPVDEVTIDYLTSLHVAAHCGHVRVAKLLLDRKADPNARALNGFTPLHIACKKNRIKVVELLLKHGASIESTTESGLTPLHVASFMGCMNIVIFLLQHEANPDVPTVRGETPLHLAARANQTDIIRILLRNGAKVDARAREEQTPLHIASRLGNVDIVMLLLQHGASVDTTTKDMYTALHIAAKEGQEEVAAILVENHASVKALTKNGFTPLHIAAKYGNVNVAKILLQKDSKLDSQGKNDITPLHLACHYDHSNVANMILEKGASPNLASQNGHTPLHIAARKNQMDIASTLLEHGADPNAQSKAGFTPLQLSAQKGHYDMTNLLIEHGADPNHKSKNGLTALHLCAQEDSIRVASILVKNGANVESQTESGYRPIHVASHFGNLSMIRFLLKHNAQIDVRTSHNYTPLHQAAQQGHAHIVTALLEGNASHNAKTTDGLTALNIAQKLGYISVMEVLKGLDYDTQTPDNKTWEEKYKVIAPESLQETCFMSDSDDEGVSDGLTNEQPYRYLTADIMKSLRDDSLPIDVTRDDPIHRQLSHEEKQEFTQSNNYCPPENFDSTDAINVGRLHFRSFLVSFLVDARGGTMKGCRHSGIRIIVPPGRATMPIRVTCRLLKPSKVANPPALMEGEALATRIIEMGPVGATFLGPVLIDIPHFASIEGKEREIIIMRSENGETWKEHDNSRDNDDTLFNTAHDTQMSSSHPGRITRIITTEFPQYFAIITRIKQEVHVIGADGGILISSVANHVQAVFPPGALTKKIKVGLQAHVIPAELTAKLLGNCVAVSPVITIEPRRRKFHKPITLTIPVPQAANKGMINEYGGETPTLRLLCSIAGGTSEAQWEDVTGSTPLTFLNNRVSFTTTVSARFWLMDCRNISEVPKMATDLYKESLFVPFITNFVIYSKRFDVVEATLRILCMTDGKDGLHTLEKQEEFLEIVKSRDVEALDGKDLYLEFSGNLVPVTKSGQQLKFTFKAFRQNRLSFHVKVKDQLLDPVARMMFMREPKVAKGEIAQQPICILNIVLPEPTVPKTPSNSKLKELEYDFISKMDIYKTTYMRDYGEKRDLPKPTSPTQQKLISDILDKKQSDAEINESLAQKVACPLESVDGSYPNNINDSNINDKEELLSPNLEKQTYSEKRKFWEDITRKRDSYQRSESEISRASQITINESDSDYLQNPISEEEMDNMFDSAMRSETMEDLNIPDMSECSVAEKAHYFEEQIQKEITATSVSRPLSKLMSQESLPRDKRFSTDSSVCEQFKDKDLSPEVKKVEQDDGKNLVGKVDQEKSEDKLPIDGTGKEEMIKEQSDLKVGRLEAEESNERDLKEEKGVKGEEKLPTEGIGKKEAIKKQGDLKLGTLEAIESYDRGLQEEKEVRREDKLPTDKEGMKHEDNLRLETIKTVEIHEKVVEEEQEVKVIDNLVGKHVKEEKSEDKLATDKEEIKKQDNLRLETIKTVEIHEKVLKEEKEVKVTHKDDKEKIEKEDKLPTEVTGKKEEEKEQDLRLETLKNVESTDRVLREEKEVKIADNLVGKYGQEDIKLPTDKEEIKDQGPLRLETIKTEESYGKVVKEEQVVKITDNLVGKHDQEEKSEDKLATDTEEMKKQGTLRLETIKTEESYDKIVKEEQEVKITDNLVDKHDQEEKRKDKLPTDKEEMKQQDNLRLETIKTVEIHEKVLKEEKEVKVTHKDDKEKIEKEDKLPTEVTGKKEEEKEQDLRLETLKNVESTDRVLREEKEVKTAHKDDQEKIKSEDKVPIEVTGKKEEETAQDHLRLETVKIVESHEKVLMKEQEVKITDNLVGKHDQEQKSEDKLMTDKEEIIQQDNLRLETIKTVESHKKVLIEEKEVKIAHKGDEEKVESEDKLPTEFSSNKEKIEEDIETVESTDILKEKEVKIADQLIGHKEEMKSEDKLVGDKEELKEQDDFKLKTTKTEESIERLLTEKEVKKITETSKEDESLSIKTEESKESDVESKKETKVTIDDLVEQHVKPEVLQVSDAKPSLIPRKIKSEVTTTTSIEPDKVKTVEKKVVSIEETRVIADDSINTKQICREFIDSEVKLTYQGSDATKVSPEEKVSKIPTKIKVDSFVDVDKDKENGKKESKIPVFGSKEANKGKVKEEDLKDTEDKKKKSGIPKRIETSKFEKFPLKDDVVMMETKVTEKVSQRIETHTSEREIHSQTITKTFTDPEEALRAFEGAEALHEPDTLVTTSKVDHEKLVTVEKKEVKSSELVFGDEKTVKHEEKERELKEKSSESTVTTETQEETVEDKTLKHETADKSTIQDIEVNLAGGKQIVDARASQELKSLKDQMNIHKIEDDDGVVIQEAGIKTLKEHAIDTAVRIEKDRSNDMEDMSSLGRSLEDELKAAVIHEQTHEESSRHSDTKVFPSRETTEDISRDEAFGEEFNDDSEGDEASEIEARDIAENLVQSIEDELVKRSESSSGLKMSYEFDNVTETDEDFDEHLADDLTKKFENIMGKRKESQVQVIESLDQIRATFIGHNERLDKDSTRGSLSIEEDLTKDEDSTPHDREESFLFSSSQKIMERDITMSPSSISEQIDLESLSSGKQAGQSPMPVVEYPEELKVVEEYFEQPDEYVSPIKFGYESTGARVLEIIEPSGDLRRGSRQDSVDVSSLEIDELRFEDDEEEHSLDEKYMKNLEFAKLHESPGMEALDKIGQERDLTFSPSSMSDSSLVPERSLSPKAKSGIESEDGGFSSMEPERTEVEKVSRLDTKSIDRDLKPAVVSPRTKLKELDIKPVNWSIGDEKIEIQETLEPSQAFDKELEEYQSSMVKQQSLTSLNDVSAEQESTTRSSEDVSTIESVREASKIVVESVSEMEDEELVEDKLDISCQELVASLHRQYEERTPTDEIGVSESEKDVVDEKKVEIEDKVEVAEKVKTKVEKSEQDEKDIDTLEESEKEGKESQAKALKESFSSKTKSLDEPQKHLERTLDKFAGMSMDSSPFRLKKEANVDLSARYAITVLDQVVKREIEEVKESLEAAKQDLIEELSENSETIVQIKESPSEFQFKLEPESIPNDLPFLYKAPSFEQTAEDLSGSPVAKPRKQEDTLDDESVSEKPLSDNDTLSELPSDKTMEVKILEDDSEKLPVAASRSGSDAEYFDGSSSLSVPPQPIPRKRQKPARISRKIQSESEGGSSSGESSNYQSCDYETSSRPSSSDIEVLHTASGFLSATASEYETAMMSLESSKQTSQDYQSAVSTLSSRESMKSLNSLSSGHLGSIDSTSELTETLVASEPEMDKDEIDENLELALDEDKSSGSSESDMPLDDTLDNITGDIPSKMKRSSEMIFQQISEDADTIPEGEGSTAEEGQSTKVTSSIMISEDDDLKTSTIDAISEQISGKADEDTSSPEVKLKSIEAQSTGDDIDSLELKMSSLSTIDEVENLLLTKRSVLQQASMSTSSTSGVSIETVVERDRHSPDSDSFELVDKPDIIDDFVVVEEVGREAEEFDSEGKSILIKPIPAGSIKKFDRDLENLITETKQEAPVSQALLKNELFDFESEESPPQASNEDQSSQQSFSDDEQEAKKWMEMQFTGDPRGYDLDYDRGPLEDIKEEEITDFEAGSSRFGSLGSHKGSIGSSGSMKGSLGTEYDILAGKKMFSKSIEHDNISMNSLQEFESLENTVIGENGKRIYCGSQDSVNNGSLPRRYVASRSGHGDDVSVSSLTDFEGLEKACREAHIIELKAKEEEDLLDHESPENRYRLENLPKPKPADLSAAGSFNPSTSGSDDYEKRIMEIDEIIRIAQANVEKFDRQDDTTEDISQIDITDAEKIEPITVQGQVSEVKDINVMETSTDSLEIEDDKHNNLMCRSSDSLELKTTVDYPSLSYSDSLNNVRDSQDPYAGDQFNSSRRISSDSLEVQILEQPEERNTEGSVCQSENKITNNGKTYPATTHA